MGSSKRSIMARLFCGRLKRAAMLIYLEEKENAYFAITIK